MHSFHFNIQYSNPVIRFLITAISQPRSSRSLFQRLRVDLHAALGQGLGVRGVRGRRQVGRHCTAAG